MTLFHASVALERPLLLRRSTQALIHLILNLLTATNLLNAARGHRPSSAKAPAGGSYWPHLNYVVVTIPGRGDCQEDVLLLRRVAQIANADLCGLARTGHYDPLFFRKYLLEIYKVLHF